MPTTSPAHPTTTLLTGATGFVGRALLPSLLASGRAVRCLTRDIGRARLQLGRGTDGALLDACEWVEGDVGDPRACARALQRCDAAFYLVHGMGDGASYHEREVAAARVFAAAAASAGLRRIVYLGGVAPAARHLAADGAGRESAVADQPESARPAEQEPTAPPHGSLHLRSRLAVGRLLRAGPVETIELRSSMIIGHGSLGWQIVRDLVARLPFMVLPRWLRSRTEPVAVDDVVVALLGALELPLGRGDVHQRTRARWFDIPGPAVMSGREILEQAADAMGMARPRIVEVGLLSPGLSSQ
jgi:uncharacterized protein YbjT (DUF2867 family)